MQQSTEAFAAGHGSLKTYLTGFVLSIILTVIPFGLVMNGALSHSALLWSILLAAIVQIVVHMHYFLHLDTSSEERWNVMVLVYTVLIIGILVGGSLWIMHNLHVRMMPDSMPGMSASMATMPGKAMR